MCGLTGFIDSTSGTPGEELAAMATRMAATISHRGPDDSGAWADPKAGIAFGFRRLAIIDLTPAGHQPMTSARGRYTLVFNGEIYNHLDIRRELEIDGLAPLWRGHSDTETLLAAISAWDVQRAVRKAVGMFAFACWDREDGTLTLGRDRLGEKPLYYGWQGSAFLFGSELKTLRAHPAFQAAIDPEALGLFFRHGYVPDPRSIYAGISKLPAGTTLTVYPNRPGGLASPRPYWSLADAIAAGRRNPITDPTEAVDALEDVLTHAIRGQMVADVPLGAFLSGGIDSSAIVALMQAQSDRAIKTFTIGFAEAGYNEASHARAVADHLGTDHTELTVTSDEAMAVIPHLPDIWDEPFADASQIPTLLVSELAKRAVTVSLSGDGGDELFAGYSRYGISESLWKRIGWAPRPVRTAAGTLLAGMPAGVADGALAPLGRLMPSETGARRIGHSLNQLGSLMRAADGPEAAYLAMISHWDHAPMAASVTAASPYADSPDALGGVDFAAWMAAADTLAYLPDDILVKLDRAAMAVSLESRAPLLDHRVVELAWQIDPAIKVRDGVRKWPLRQLLYRHVPRELVERPKRGFAVPIAAWLRGPLRPWAESLLSDAALSRSGLLDPQAIRQTWIEHQSGRHDWSYRLWDVLMFQAWDAAR